MRRMGLLLMAGLLASPGPAHAQSQAQQDDVPPLPGFQSFVHVLRARGYRPLRTVPAGRSDFFLNDRGVGRIRHRYPELASCSGVDLNTCTFLFVRPGKTAVEVETTGEYPDDLIIFSIERLNPDQAAAVYRQGCDVGPNPDRPCPR